MEILTAALGTSGRAGFSGNKRKHRYSDGAAEQHAPASLLTKGAECHLIRLFADRR